MHPTVQQYPSLPASHGTPRKRTASTPPIPQACPHIHSPPSTASPKTGLKDGAPAFPITNNTKTHYPTMVTVGG